MRRPTGTPAPRPSRVRLSGVMLAAVLFGTIALAGCTSTVDPAPANSTDSGASTATTTSGHVFDPRTDRIAVARDQIEFPDTAAAKLFDRTRAAAAAAGKGWQHVEREYRGGNYADEKWCSPQVTANECETTRAPEARGAHTIRQSIYTYDQQTPMTAEGQSLAVSENATAADGWSVQATVQLRRPSPQNPQDAGDQSFQATLVRGATLADRADETALAAPTITVTDAPSYALAGLPPGTQVRDGTVALKPEGDALQQLAGFTTSAEAMRARLMSRWAKLQMAVDKTLGDKDFKVCVQQSSLRGSRALVQPQGLSMPAPECVPRPVTDVDVATLQAAAATWFADQRRLLGESTPEIYAALMAAFPWKSLASS